MNQDKKNRIEDHFYVVGLCAPLTAAVAFFVFSRLPKELRRMLFMPCLFHRVTGLYCPGCGGTRAVWALLSGRPVLSFFYHPIVLYAAVLYLLFMVSHTIERITSHRWRIGMRFKSGYLYFALVLIAINIAVKDIALTAFHFDIIQMLDSVR